MHWARQGFFKYDTISTSTKRKKVNKLNGIKMLKFHASNDITRKVKNATHAMG